ncbi:MAG: hypothetical protein A2219_00880 [Elusimicrobia bacterium RIFOXYA2_FULL_50_26]|nr:MAG: hypothetical protein A2219_00880 [Elusimicrobia bacterium RIFOXYA2_FULL_50_26]OGS24227.1 MAG: hypothetical protein A2314_00960 [Elusimicrobia bacterium RIFOXYB2_FULL_50_12]
MKVALVFNPFSYKVHEENLRIVQRYFGLFPPLSLAWVAAMIRKAGHDVTIIDARTLRLTMPEVAGRLKKYRPDVIGAMATTYMFPDTLAWISYLRRELEAAGCPVKTLLGGYNMRVYPRESLSHHEIDFGCLEHAYYTVPALLGALERGANNFESVPGLAWKRAGEIVINPHPQVVSFDDFPNPARDLLPNELYAEFPTRRKNFTVMVTSLGCPYRCNFCEAGGEAYNARSPRTVVGEMKECVEKYGIREIDFFDYEFTASKKRVTELCSLIRENGLDVDWACRSRVDTVDSEMLGAMQAAGCRRVYWGIEHGSQAVLNRLNKGITREQIVETIRMSRRAGMQNLGFFLVGVPGETRETVKETLSFARELDLDYVQFSKLLAKPLTPLWKDMVKSAGRDYWAGWVSGAEKDRELPRPWLTSLKNGEVDRLARWAYVSYYSRPGFLLRHTFQCSSVAEFLRKFFAYIEMVFFQEKVARPARRFAAYSENIFKVLARRFAWVRNNG